MKILIIGEVYSSNLGDGIICKNVENIIKQQVSEKKIEVTLADISCRKGYIKQGKSTKVRMKCFRNILHKSEYLTYKIQDLKRRKKIKAICEKKQYDIAIFAGGHLFMPYFVFQIADFVHYLSKQGTKIIFNACGVGEIKSPILQLKIRKTLKDKNMIQISSRDDVEKLQKKYMKKNELFVQKTYDPAIYTNETYHRMKKENSNLIGLGIMKVGTISKEEIINFWEEIIRGLEKKQKKWQLFCNGSKEDYELACECLTKLGYEKNNQYLAEQPTNPQELVEIIANYQCMISFRLHSHIVAYSLDIPTIAIVWDEKVRFFFRDLKLEDRCYRIEENRETILQKLEEIKTQEYDVQLRQNQKKVIKEKLMKYILE